MNLVLHLMKISEFEVFNGNARNGTIELQKTSKPKCIYIFHENDSYIDFNTENGVAHLAVKRFGTKKLEHSVMDLNLIDKVDYFNFSVQNNPGRLTMDDISVLKEIRERAIRILENEKTV